jgi:hypothetical protein
MYIRIPEGLGQEPTPSLDTEFEEFLRTADKQNFVKVLEGLRNTLNSWVGDYGASLGQIIIRRAIQFLEIAYLKAHSEPNSSDRNNSVKSIMTAFEVLGFLRLILVVEVMLKILLDLVTVVFPAGIPTILLRICALAATAATIAASTKKLKTILTTLSTAVNAVKTLDTLRRAHSFYVENRREIVTLSSPPP